MSIRFDKETGKTYTHHNIPISKKGRLTAIQNNGAYYKIMNENRNNPEDSWYNGRFIGDRYAVFKWVNTSVSSGFWQQVTNWYCRFGMAQRKLAELAN